MNLCIIAIDGTGNQTADFLSLLRVSAGLINADSARLLTSDDSAKDTEIECINIGYLDYLTYSRFCVEKLADYVTTGHSLCVQLDGFILNPDLWDDNFLEYDFIGAPWKSKPHRPMVTNCNVGNGGFSLRSKHYLGVSKQCPWKNNWQGANVPDRHQGNEDYFLNVIQRDLMMNNGVRFAPEEVAARFSIQEGDQLASGHNITSVFGFHGKKLVRKARRHTMRRGIIYPHLNGIRSSIFPLRSKSKHSNN
jgi:hypothetical protein